jgi:hypothetical protein
VHKEPLVFDEVHPSQRSYKYSKVLSAESQALCLSSLLSV